MLFKRADGRAIRNLDPFMRVMPSIMKKRSDAHVFYKHDVDCEILEKFVRRKRVEGINISYMEIIIAALLRTLALRPFLNRFIVNGATFARYGYDISFAIKKELRDDAEETTIKLHFKGTESLSDISAAIKEAVVGNKGSGKENETDALAKLITKPPLFLIKCLVAFIMWMDRHNIMPKAILEASPFHTSLFVTNMRSIGLDAIYHHIYDFGTTGLFVSMGKEERRAVVDKDGQILARKMMTLGVVGDERICDGLYFANSLKCALKFLGNPELLEEPLEKVNEDVE